MTGCSLVCRVTPGARPSTIDPRKERGGGGGGRGGGRGGE
jgi:hypothetical protein